MFITALCPTYRHPALVANTLWLWEQQSYPADRRFLLILDDGGTFEPQLGPNWRIRCTDQRFPSITAKYNAMVRLAPRETEAFVVWEDDDVYAPGYLSVHTRVLTVHELSKPSQVLSDYPGEIVVEHAAGRFHSSLAFRPELLERVNGWPATKRADFDQQLIASLFRAAKSTGDPCDYGVMPYIYRWHTGHPHGQGTMRSPDDETWWDRVHRPEKRQAGRIVSVADVQTRKFLEAAPWRSNSLLSC
jgi:hypothetical protein